MLWVGCAYAHPYSMHLMCLFHFSQAETIKFLTNEHYCNIVLPSQ